ncbi:hypothetical protein HYPSUDRAFT_172585 [Hypholoma sublateritium FD-334 SS-4]|uniref:BTB domain-containing protein n=1 Tax=Hypholoma sublateritium (strain FD-334 SS-4) TaxID=945553 RepID=A0A0D2LX53_HYPSF|nr:hypothetical protein HYPSUDRAFT_172585 [Hypholoma sublateritium FD-334 SS-4]
MGDFAQRTTQLGALRGILGSYPYSVGLLREILQNSDDAQASKQIFALDRRTHPSALLLHPNLASTQGPALLAYNDAKFNETDWSALQTTYESSKVDDSSKIGKYGVGFRSVFHITDCPQIVSGSTFAMFDPLKAFTDSAGRRDDLRHTMANSPDHLTSFSGLPVPIPSLSNPNEFDGTVIRCPLRSKASDISSKLVRPADIAHLFHEFVSEEIGICLLFLRHIRHIEIYDVNERGETTVVADLTISRSLPILFEDDKVETYTAIVKMRTRDQAKEKSWRILHSRSDQQEIIQLLGKDDIRETLKKHKLLPDIGIAIPTSITTEREIFGRLFTFLPLPLPTNFPAHIHAYFALSQSRQNLRNSSEIGLVPGSDDHTLVRWNEHLFTRHIPRTWAKLLEILVNNHGEIEDIFNAWPPEQPPASSGESLYWEALPINLIRFTATAQSPIWPVYQSNKSSSSRTEFDSLSALLIVDPAASTRLLGALTTVGLRLTRPPPYIFDLIKKLNVESGIVSAILTPKEAHLHLLNHLPELANASTDDINIISEYLLSNNDVLNVVGLPIFRLANDTIVALSPLEKQEAAFVLFDRKAFDVFGACDDHAIRLDLLPKIVAETIRDLGPKKLNVEVLKVPKIVQYLTIYPNRLGLDVSAGTTDPRALKWLSEYWIWQETFALKDELYSKIQGLYLLPSSRGLRRADSPLFLSRGAHPTSVRHLSSLGIPFLEDKLSDRAQSILIVYGLLKSITDIWAILDSLPASFDPSLALSRDASTAILTHLANSISTSRAMNSDLEPDRIRQLKSLPIYPIAEFPPSSRAIVITCRSLPDGDKIRAIGAPSFLPTISGTSFVQFPAHNALAMSILHYIESPTSRVLSDQELLVLTVENLLDQPDHIHAAILSYMEIHRRQVPPFVLDMLKQVAFVAVLDGSRRQPKDVIDPFSPIAPLYATSPERNARKTNPSDQAIIQALHSLKLMQHTLTVDIVQDRIGYVASTPSSSLSISLSRNLLTLVSQTHLDYTKLIISPEQRWLPTSQGLRGSAECRDTAQLSRHLFDEVLAILESFDLPRSLRQALGWDQPLPTHVLFQQLAKVLGNDGDIFSVVCDIIKQIGRRVLNDDELERLKDITQNRKWVPTSDGQLSDSSSAIFSKPVPDSGFFQIFHADGQTMALLRKLGCSDKPLTAGIILKLQILRGAQPSLEVVTSALGLLRSIESDLTDEDRSRLLIPDINYNLRPFSVTFFNDIGDEARLMTEDDDCISHPLVDESLSRKLSLGRLGLKYVGLGIPGVDMGEKPVVTVRRTLTQYTEKQFVTEFLANAADANATEFTVLVNGFSVKPSAAMSVRALYPALDKFCEVPSLVVHNNAKFSDKDFTGICRTSVGGKEGRRETIGQFGLGALTMFHFTELAIIISNGHVLFLNPSKGHLPYRDQAAYLLPLELVKKRYSRHLLPVDGLFGFDISKNEPYEGTIFLLPLRTESHYEGSIDSISHVPWTTNQVELNILNALRESASKCLIFTKLRRISGMTRDENGAQTTAWKFETEHIHIHTEPNTGYSISDVTIKDDSDASTTWKVASTRVENLTVQMPEDLELFANERRLRSPAAGLAMLFDDSSQKDNSFNFFSTLPLGIQNSLPVHVNASFILSSDRRQIRLDNYGGAETSYNKWLLTEIIPPLYYFLLAYSLHHGEATDNGHWWPRHRNNDDHHSRLIVDAFYGPKLRNCDRKLFRCFYWPSILLTVREVILSGDESSSISAALKALQSRRVAQLSKGAYRLATDHAGISKVTPAFLKEEIAQEIPQVFTQNVGFKVLQDIIDYLSPGTLGDDPTNLVGLRILPLDNGEFGTIVRLEDITINNTEDDTEPRPRLYFVWAPKRGKPHNFRFHHFVHHKLATSKLLKMGINVASLNSPAIKALIEERLDAYSPFETLPPEICRWIEDFWESWIEYERLGLLPSEISDFPLVPTLNNGVFISLDHCRDGTALIVGGSSENDEAIRACLVNLGLIVVRLDQEPTPDALQTIFKSPEYPKLSITSVLTGLLLQPDDVAQKFADIDLDMQRAFASWAQRNVHTVPEHLFEIAHKIPIWPSVKTGSPEKLRPASEIDLLPDGLPLQSTGRFMSRSVAAHPQLKYLITPLPLEDMDGQLVLPTTMDAEETRDYREFLRAWVPQLPQWYTRPIRVPNHNRVVTSSSDLYARHPLFEAAFGADSEHFVAQELIELESLLHKHQLRHESQLDVNMFRVCAQALSNGQDEDLVARAVVLFHAYCFSLPMHVNAGEPDIWHELDQISFVPRDTTSERRLDTQAQQLDAFLNIPLSITNLPDVVAPLNLVRKEFEAVAWTQRALFAEQPHQRVLLAYPALGRPDISDAIQHLKALSSMRYSSVGQQQIILHDLKETYAFLSGNVLLATEDDRRQLATNSLFLNVDDPDNDPWLWDDCEHLVFETHDTEGSFRYVRSFLKPYSQLLRHIGALEVHHPSYTSDHSSSSESSKLEAIRQGFDMLRKQNRSLTDVVFDVDDSNDSLGEDLPPLVAHRAFLAVASDHFLDAFCGDFVESRAASQDHPVKINVLDHSRECVQSVLDYIYTGIQSVEDAPLDLLLQIMKLSGYWRIADLFEDMQKEIVTRRLITPETLDSIKEFAEAARAENLVRTCAEYEERNAAFIAKVRQSVPLDQDSVQDGSSQRDDV